MKKGFHWYKKWYNDHKWLVNEYHSIIVTAIKELQHSKQIVEKQNNLLIEVEELLNKWAKPSLIQKVIENWKQRIIIDTSIHYDLECGWIQGFKRD